GFVAAEAALEADVVGSLAGSVVRGVDDVHEHAARGAGSFDREELRLHWAANLGIHGPLLPLRASRTAPGPSVGQGETFRFSPQLGHWPRFLASFVNSRTSIGIVASFQRSPHL